MVEIPLWADPRDPDEDPAKSRARNPGILLGFVAFILITPARKPVRLWPDRIGTSGSSLTYNLSFFRAGAIQLAGVPDPTGNEHRRLIPARNVPDSSTTPWVWLEAFPESEGFRRGVNRYDGRSGD